MHLEHHLVGGYVRYISPHIIIIIIIIMYNAQILPEIPNNPEIGPQVVKKNVTCIFLTSQFLIWAKLKVIHES